MPPNLTISGATPIAAWIPSLDDTGNGTTTLYDLTGNAYDGTLTNMDAGTDWVADTSNGGVRRLDFDGIGDYIEIGDINAAEGVAAITVSAWVKFANTTGGTAGEGIVSKWDGTNLSWLLWQAQGANGVVRFRVYNASTFADSGTWGPDTDWHHVLGVYDGSTVELYVDGVKQGSGGSLTGNVMATTAPVRLATYGANSPLSSFRLTGALDDVRLFDIALDSTQIAALYNSGNGRGVVGSSGSALLPFLLAHFSQGIM